MRDVIDIATETSPADGYDALTDVLGNAAQRVMNGLEFVGGGQFVGQAVTLRSLPARDDFIAEVEARSLESYEVSSPLAHAISLCDEQSVLVIDASGYNHSAVSGGTTLSALAVRAAGLVTDGALRDRSEFVRYADSYGFKVCCHGWTVQSGTGTALYPSDVNLPVAVHGVLVHPGDYLFGNSDAVLVIPEQNAEEILELGVVYSKLNDFLTQEVEKRRGILGKDIKVAAPETVKAFLEYAKLSDRQDDLFRTYVND